MRIFDKLVYDDYKNIISFHVPGHKYSERLKKYFDKLDSILDIDVTEIPGTDDLFDSQEALLESQKNASKIYKTKESFFLVNGTTSGIYSMIMAATSPGDKILVARDCHRAVFDGIFLGNLNAEYITPEVCNSTNLILGITPEAVIKSVKENPDAKALILTYPNYYGICSDIRAISKIVHDNNMVLLVDGAHGAHLMLNKEFPISSLEAGADIVVHSSHKSLPVFTQASMLHLNSDRVSLKKLKYMLKIHQTSSPSYILMSSLDIGMNIIEEEGKDLAKELVDNISEFKNKLKGSKIRFFDKSYLKDTGFSLDITKLTLLGKQSDVDPVDFENILRKNGIQIEFSNKNNGVLVTSICNKKADFDKLLKFMKKSYYKSYSGINSIFINHRLEIKRSIKDSFYSRKRNILLKDGKDKISSDYIIPYPPGIPILIPGELIDDKIIAYVRLLIENNIKLVGNYEKYSDFNSFSIEITEE